MKASDNKIEMQSIINTITLIASSKLISTMCFAQLLVLGNGGDGFVVEGEVTAGVGKSIASFSGASSSEWLSSSLAGLDSASCILGIFAGLTSTFSLAS